MTRRCWTCDLVVEDATAERCGRQHCAAKRDVERDTKAGQGTRPPQWSGPYPFQSVITSPEATHSFSQKDDAKFTITSGPLAGLKY